MIESFWPIVNVKKGKTMDSMPWSFYRRQRKLRYSLIQLKLLSIIKKGRPLIQSVLPSNNDRECLADDLKLLTYCQCEKSQDNWFNAMILLLRTKKATLFFNTVEAFVDNKERKTIDSKRLAFIKWQRMSGRLLKASDLLSMSKKARQLIQCHDPFVDNKES